VLFLLVTGGSAYATRHYLITSTKQIKPSVRRALRGATGAIGAPGATGATGATGPDLTVLPTGETETGVYEADGTATTSGDLASASISFAVPLVSAPTPTVITSAPTAACPGSASAPSAAAGQLCVYEGDHSNLGAISTDNPTDGDANAASSDGAGLVIDSSAAGNFYSSGSWAVTAP
jgi:collagen type VII alpha